MTLQQEAGNSYQLAQHAQAQLELAKREVAREAAIVESLEDQLKVAFAAVKLGVEKQVRNHETRAATRKMSPDVKGEATESMGNRFSPESFTKKSATGKARRHPMERLIESTEFAANGCWLYGRYVGPSGYAYIGFGGKGRKISVHRLAYQFFMGLVPATTHLDHLCRNRHCWNPFHLEPKTPLANVRASSHCGATDTHCRNGHEYNAENTYHMKRGGYRQCRICGRQAQRAHRAARRRGAV